MRKREHKTKEGKQNGDRDNNSDSRVALLPQCLESHKVLKLKEKALFPEGRTPTPGEGEGVIPGGKNARKCPSDGHFRGLDKICQNVLKLSIR